MPAPAVIPRSSFIARTAQPLYSHVGNSTRAKLDRLWLTALRAMVDVEPYGSSDLGPDPSDDEPPSMTSASPSEDDDLEDPENPSGRKKKKKKRKTRRPEGRRSQEAKAIATSKIVVNLPEFTDKDLIEFAENFACRCAFFLGNSTCTLVPLCFSKSEVQNPKSTNLARSLDGAPIITQSRRHKPCSGIEVSYSAHSQLALDASLVFTDSSAIATATCDLRAAALLLFEAITLPPP